ncbi:dehydrodolichyl diphosphate synthase complex subunit DHDDS [Scaptodrosophila lebanonensis]|uniref:Alkyl transferase n=1 Tax=Drosophila lebanonensis TaxID=7225 RepID=A0A6J2TRP1_DROLE|nr:dehydrodolichyl diphosphate synthase complex subunit DHDDS [Scaptodrosophila lebanonensis]
MSWVSDYEYTFLQRQTLRVLRICRHIPHHVAFVMDGNRRFAKSKDIDKIEGHSRGFEKLADCLNWCLEIGIREVTTFAFSIENFKRSTDEVEGLFNLAREKFSKLLEESDRLNEHGIRIRVIGSIELLPQDLQKLIATAMLRTERNDKLFLNIAFSYTSRDEITQAVETVLNHERHLEEIGDNEDRLLSQDINERLLEECLYTRHSSPPDLVFRTSGETRLSDFLMWQLSSSVLYFTNVLWPQITIWNFFASIFVYQRASCRLEAFRGKERIRSAKLAKISDFYSSRVQTFLQKLDIFRRKELIKLASN